MQPRSDEKNGGAVEDPAGCGFFYAGAGEGRDLLGDLLRLVDWDEGLRVGDLDDLGVRGVGGEAFGVLIGKSQSPGAHASRIGSSALLSFSAASSV